MSTLRGDIPIIGGPLDGQKFTGTRAPLYLDEAGNSLLSHLGDRLFSPPRTMRANARVPEAAYIRRESPGQDRRLRYVHSSIALVDEMA